jgi:hypothetical protein
MPSILTRFAGALAALPETEKPFRLIDVGCSGGIDPILVQAFPNLLVDGFDPLVEEVGRLNSLGLPGHKYHNYFVVGGTRFRNEESIDEPGLSGTTFHLTSAWAAQETLRVKGTSYTQQIFNSGQAPTYAKEETTVDDFLSESQLPAPTFLKVDTDGHDYFVLKGARGILSDFSLLGIQVECQFHGAPGPNQNTFSNIDELLRASGFSLFVLDTHKYSRTELPQPFVWELFGQTASGQIQWGEAVYFRDPTVNPGFLDLIAEDEASLVHFLRLLLYFDLPDIAAATVRKISGAKLTDHDWFDVFLDELVPPNLIGASTYRTYMEKFEKSPELFLPSRWRFPGSQIALKLEGLSRRIKRRFLL